MKKLITILAIMFVLVGAVFATDDPTPTAGTTENHVITVNTHVAQILPVFNFKTANIDGTNATTKFGESTTDFTAQDTTKIYNVTSNEDISQAAISQTFTIMSMKKANYVGSFKLTVSATQFKTTATKTVGADTVPVYTTESTITYTYPTETKTLEDGRLTVTPTAATSEAPAYLTATFEGRQDTESQILANVTVEWSRDIEAVPGDYKADVTLEVKAL